ncbi:MAG: FKBP-type peptidyl-prolyl cis-trans isomerase [Thermoprotei archaeon]
MNKGDFILIDYVARIKETGEILDLTLEEVAKKEKFARSDGIYEPMLVVVGKNWVPKGLDEELEKMNVNENKVVEISPEKAFGKRDPKKIKIVSVRELPKEGGPIRVGSVVTVEGLEGIVLSVGGGRAVIDFNHPLAGKTIVYEVTVRNVIEKLEDKIMALLSRRIRGLDKSKVQIEKINDEVTIRLPSDILTAENIQYALKGVADDIKELLPEIRALKYSISFELQLPKTTEKIEEQKKEEKAPSASETVTTVTQQETQQATSQNTTSQQ